MNPSGVSALAARLRRFATPDGRAAFFITGSDTGVGKTSVACSLIRELRRCGVRAAGFKPICCGDRRDAVQLWKAANKAADLEVINPVHLLRPLAPAAQACPSWPILSRTIRRAFTRLRTAGFEMVLVEGAGGLLCPIRHGKTMRELASLLRLPMVLVVRDRLGVLNHTLLTLEAARSAGLKCVALVLTRFGKRPQMVQTTNLTILKHWTGLDIYVV